VLPASGNVRLGPLTRRAALLAVSVAMMGSAMIAPTASAYNGAAAAAWADAHALTHTCWSPGNPNALPCDTNDCTNFVSLALHYGGGYPEFLGTGIVTDDHLWFLTKNGLNLWVQSNSWAYVTDQYQFQMLHSPGGVTRGTASGLAGYSFSGLSAGDLLFYDFEGNGSLDHVAIQTTPGTDPNWNSGNQYGDLADEHTSDRRRVWWTLNPYNPYRNYTVITLVHIQATN
jgi:hypothetical protein